MLIARPARHPSADFAAHVLPGDSDAVANLPPWLRVAERRAEARTAAGAAGTAGGVPLLDRRCAPCTPTNGSGGGALHGLSTDPAGRRGHCLCYVTSENHRLQWAEWDYGALATSAGEPDADPEYDGGLGRRARFSSAAVRFEQEAEAADARQRGEAPASHPPAGGGGPR